MRLAVCVDEKRHLEVKNAWGFDLDSVSGTFLWRGRMVEWAV